MHMRIVKALKVVADLPDWDGPIPRTGDYVSHPPASAGPEQVDRVMAVTWRIYGRVDGNAVQTAHPCVEIVLSS